MGFQVVFKYHERLEEGGYNKDETKEMKRKIGDAYDDVPLEKLATAVMAQLARRDIWVVDWEVYEYKKTKLRCKETVGGIIIKNKKFLLDNAANLVMQDLPEEQPALGNGAVRAHQLLPNVQPHQALQPAGAPRRAVRFVVLDEDLPIMHEVKQKGLQFTPGKRYPVFHEQPHPTLLGVRVFTMLDDRGRELQVTDKYFLPADTHLQKDDPRDSFSKPNTGASPEPKLMYDGLTDDPVPELRGVGG